MNDYRVWVEDQGPILGTSNLVVVKKHSKNTRAVWLLRDTDIGIEEMSLGTPLPEGAPMSMDTGEMRQVMQAFLDEAWGMGLRPTGQSGDLGELRRVTDHLGDLREIVRRLLPEDKPAVITGGSRTGKTFSDA